MKRKIAVVLLMLFVISFSLIAFTACGNNDNNDDIADVGGSENPDNNGGSGNTNNGGNTEQSKCVPVYQGMTITNNNTSISLTSASYISGGVMLLSASNENNGNNENHNGHYKGDHADRDNVVDNDNPYPDNSDSENIEEEIKSSLNVIGATSDLYYATQNQDVYINIHIYNPDNFEIMSFTLNGKKYSSYMFEEGSDMETIVLKYNVGAVSGIAEYTIDAIKYIDGTEIKDVIIDGNKTVKAGIKTANQLTASISNVDIDTNALSFNANIIDKDNLIVFSSGALKAVIYDGAEIVAQKDLTVGENSITFDNLKTNTLYQYAIVGYYDDLSGDGFKMNVLYKDAFYTDSVVLFDNITVGQKNVNFSFLWHENHLGKAISALKLYKGETFVKDLAANATAIDGLLSNTTYKLVAEYPNGDKTESIYHEFTTLAKAVPEISVHTPVITQTSVGFTITENDVDNVGAVTKIELVHAKGTVVADSIDQREFANLLSDNAYTVKVTYVYNLNDGTGDKTVTKELAITTLAKATPAISVINPTKTQTSVGFEIAETDADNIGAVTKIELVHANGTIVADALEQRTFANLLSNNAYTVKVTYVYNLNDGTGDKTVTKELAITTLAKATPDFTISNTAKGQESLSFSVSVTDTDSVGAITKVELIHGTEITTLANAATHEITELLSNNDYTIRVTYTYDLNDGEGNREIIKELIARTLSKQAPSITVNSATEKNAIYVEISNNDTDKTLIEVEATVLLDGTIVKTQKVTEIFTVEELLYSTNYSVYITAYYDLNDGAGVRSKEFHSTVTTLNYVDEQGVSYKVSQDGTATVVELSEKHMTNIIIPEEVIGYNVTSIGDCAFKDCTNLVSVIIPDTVETIGYNAFNGCSALKTLIIGNGVTTLCGGLLSGCSSLENLTIPFVGYSKNATSFSQSSLFGWIFGTESYAGGVDTNQYFIQYCIPSSLTSVTVNGGNIPEYAFYECDNITSIVIPNSVTVINERTFFSCDSLVSVTIPSSVIGIEDHAFYSCTSLTSVTIPDSVEYIGNYAFGACNSLINVNIPNSVTTLRSYVFWACDSLISATIGNGVDDIGALFYSCTSLTSVTLSNGIKSIGGYAFYGCTNLTSITIPESVDSFGDYAFGNCSRLEEIHFNATRIVEDWCGTEVFYDAGTYGNGINMFVGKDVIKIPASLFEASSPPKITYVTFEDGSSCQSIGKRAFYGCTNLVRFDIPNNVNSIEEYAFYGCTSLISVTIPDGVRNVGERTFYKCSNLTIYCMAGSKPGEWDRDWNYSDCPVIWNYENLGVTNEGILWICYDNAVYIIGYCGESSDIIIPRSIDTKAVIGIGNYAFSDCASLMSVTIPDSVTSIGVSAFEDCTSLTIYCEAASKPSGWNSYWSNSSQNVVVWDCKNNDVATDGYVYTVVDGVRYRIGDSIATVVKQPQNIVIASIPKIVIYKGISYSVTSIEYAAFNGCSNLTSVTIPDSVTSIGDWAFRGCKSLTSVMIPDSVTIIGNSVFFGCSNLTSITIPDGITRIDGFAFGECSSLTSINVPYSVTSIEGEVFYACMNLTSITFDGTVAQWNAISKDSDWDHYNAITRVICSDGSVSI